MEVGQGQNWGCNAKEKKKIQKLAVGEMVLCLPFTV
jgi:hypothetical protein